jgi:hypothetical protein
MTDDKPQPVTAPTVKSKEKTVEPPPDRKPRDVIPVAKLTMRSDLTIDWPSYPGGTRAIEASDQIRIEYHSMLSMFVVDWKPRPGGTEKPFRKYIPREWCSFEPL